MALNNPSVGAKGLWKLKDPYGSYLPVNTSLTCTAISNYGQLVAMGMDPFDLFYKPYGIDKAIYQEHFDGEGRIVFLKTDNGKRYSFPLHYLVSYPIGTGVNYVSMGIGIRLGALPVNTNLELLITQIKELCNLNVGVDIHVESCALSEINIIDNTDHVRLENARAAKKKAQTPALAKASTLLDTNKEISNKLKYAENKVIEQHNRILELEDKLRKAGITP